MNIIMIHNYGRLQLQEDEAKTMQLKNTPQQKDSGMMMDVK